VAPKEDVAAGEEIHHRKLGSVISEKGLSGLFGNRLWFSRSESGKIAGDARLTDFEVQLEEFAVDARSAPCVVFLVKSPNGFASLDRNRRRAAALGVATPERLEPAAMPFDDSFRRYDSEGAAPAQPPSAEADPEETIGVSDRGMWMVGFVHSQLLAEGGVLENKIVVREERGARPPLGCIGRVEDAASTPGGGWR
jgi:hypothetical protein